MTTAITATSRSIKLRQFDIDDLVSLRQELEALGLDHSWLPSSRSTMDALAKAIRPLLNPGQEMRRTRRGFPGYIIHASKAQGRGHTEQHNLAPRWSAIVRPGAQLSIEGIDDSAAALVRQRWDGYRNSAGHGQVLRTLNARLAELRCIREDTNRWFVNDDAIDALTLWGEAAGFDMENTAVNSLFVKQQIILDEGGVQSILGAFTGEFAARAEELREQILQPGQRSSRWHKGHEARVDDLKARIAIAEKMTGTALTSLADAASDLRTQEGAASLGSMLSMF